MTTQLLRPQTGYVRLLASDGTALQHSSGVLSVGASFSGDVQSSVHDNFLCNANMMVGDADVGAGNPVPISDNGGSLTVDASGLDIRALDSATDSVAVTASSLDIRALTTSDEVTVSATDLDIRALSSASDSVSVVPQSNSATLYDNASTSGDSTALDKQNCKDVSFVGTVSGACNFDIKVSQDGTNYFVSGTQIQVAGAGSFHANFRSMFRYVRLSPSANITASVYGACM